MRAKIFLDYILLNLDIKTQITCNYHAVAIPVTNGKGVKPMATESDASRTWPIISTFCVVGARIYRVS